MVLNKFLLISFHYLILKGKPTLHCIALEFFYGINREVIMYNLNDATTENIITLELERTNLDMCG